eukprot:6214925-Prymnesium_polylepis.1
MLSRALPPDCIIGILGAARAKELARAAGIAREWNHSAQMVAHGAVLKHQQACTLGTATHALLDPLPKETWINVLRLSEDLDQCVICDKMVASFSRPGTRQAAQCVDCDTHVASLCSTCTDVWVSHDAFSQDRESGDWHAQEIQGHHDFRQLGGALCCQCDGYLCAGCLDPDCGEDVQVGQPGGEDEERMCGECLQHSANACPYPRTLHCYC